MFKAFDVWPFQMLNGVGDLLDIIPALNSTARLDWEHMSPDDLSLAIAKRGLCSGLIKVLGDYSDLYAAHSSWFIFGATNRIFKHYNFALSSQQIAAHKMSFSSYPGFLESLDDFYLLDSGLAMVQTTNSIFNYTLYDVVGPNSLLAWQRVRLANHMASTGQEWFELVSQYNSGTYNSKRLRLRVHCAR
jgi:hypothetical protein